MRKTSNILIVDDEPRMRDSIKRLLEDRDLYMNVAANGQTALEAMDERNYDLVLLDVCMPEMDGFEFMERVNGSQPDTPVIIITGDVSTDSAIQALKMGAYAYLKKPLTPEELINNVTNALEQKRLKDENREINARLIQSEKRYRSLVQHSPDMIYTLDQDGVFVFVNDTVEKLLGYNSYQLVGKPYCSIVHWNGDLPREGFFYEPRTSELIRADGTTCYVETSVSTIEDTRGRPIGARGIDRDISRRKKLENDLLKSFRKLENVKFSTIMGLAKLAEYRDESTGIHLERIQEYTKVIASTMSTYPNYNDYITEDYVQDIYQSSILHDIGKVGIPDSILLKPGRLSPEEFEIIKRHCKIGGDALSAVETRIEGQSFLSLGKEIAYHHHERWDGTGYPDRLKGEKIPLSARQVALADVYDALTSERAYKKAYSHEMAKEIIVQSRGTHFDPEIVDAFLDRENEFKEIRYSRFSSQIEYEVTTEDSLKLLLEPL